MSISSDTIHGNPVELAGMAVWRKFGGAISPYDRTEEQQAWDSGILAAAEYLRRLGCPEKFYLAALDMQTECEITSRPKKQRKDKA